MSRPDTEILLLKERVLNTIQLGESHFREFKTALRGKPGEKIPRIVRNICAEIGEALVAFANADGGAILIGVEDDGTITGVPHNDGDLQTMLRAVETHVLAGQQLPITNANKLMLGEHAILYFAVQKGTTMIYQTSDGRCVKRKDKDTVPAVIKHIEFERQEIRSREYESEFIDGAAVTDLDLQALQGVADQYIKGLGVERYLQQVGLAEYTINGLRLRRAALLLFAKDINKWHPRSQVRILKVKGNILGYGDTYNVISDDTITGNILDLIFKTWEHLRSYLAYKTEFGSNAKFEQKYIYPEDAVKEAILNAIAHRDYSITNPVEVFIFDDRMEIKNPGALLSTLSIDNLYKLEGSHESRNVLIAKVLRENQLMRELGEGMKRIFNLMRQQELERPKLYSNGLWFSVTLPNKTIFNAKELEWLRLFEDHELSKDHKQIILLGMDNKEFSANDVFKALNIGNSQTEKYTREITYLTKKGIIERTKNSNQVYNIARKEKKSKKDIPKFKIVLPS